MNERQQMVIDIGRMAVEAEEKGKRAVNPKIIREWVQLAKRLDVLHEELMEVIKPADF